MQYTGTYSSPLGQITLAADSVGLTGLWFEGQKHFGAKLDKNALDKDLPVFTDARIWLDKYFSGAEPNFEIPVHLIGTDFQLEVWTLLREIPYGKTVTYGELAAKLAARRGISKMCPRAVGSAIGKNPISIIVPCHRVLGAGGKLTGYAGGIERKIRLLELEKN